MNSDNDADDAVGIAVEITVGILENEHEDISIRQAHSFSSDTVWIAAKEGGSKLKMNNSTTVKNYYSENTIS